MRRDPILTLEQAGCLCILTVVLMIIIGVPTSWFLFGAKERCQYSDQKRTVAPDGRHLVIERIKACDSWQSYYELSQLFVLPVGASLFENSRAVFTTTAPYAFRWIDAGTVEVDISARAYFETIPDAADGVDIIIERGKK